MRNANVRTEFRAKARALLAGTALMVGLLAAPAMPAGAVAPAGAALPAGAATASAAESTCGPPTPSPTQPGYTIADPDCDLTGAPFEPLADPAGRPLSRVYTGVRDGAAYRIEVPLRWNGELVLFAHGYRGNGRTVWVDSPTLRAHHIARGYAWAASSFQTNGYDVGQGVLDSRALLDQFRASVGRRAKRVFMTGASMGGHITAVAIEHYPRAFAGALPYCGVLGDAELFDYFLDVNVAAAALTGAPIRFPRTPSPEFIEEYRRLVAAELPLLGSGWGAGAAPTLNRLGQRWAGVVRQRSGGIRPGFDAALTWWNGRPSGEPLTGAPFLFGLYPGLSGGTQGIANGNITSNRGTVYQIDGHRRLSPAERRLNRDVLRVSATTRPSPHLSGIPRVAGRPSVPVLSLHTIGDLFVPFSMEQVYARRAHQHGRSGLFVSRAVRALGHCEFTQTELTRGFDDLVRWVGTAHRPPGDNIGNRAAVARPRFGCRFTSVDRANFGAPCPR